MWEALLYKENGVSWTELTSLLNVIRSLALAWFNAEVIPPVTCYWSVLTLCCMGSLGSYHPAITGHVIMKYILYMEEGLTLNVTHVSQLIVVGL